MKCWDKNCKLNGMMFLSPVLFENANNYVKSDYLIKYICIIDNIYTLVVLFRGSF